LALLAEILVEMGLLALMALPQLLAVEQAVKAATRLILETVE
jgi:hypothetical protein